MPKTRQLALPLETHRNHYLFSDHFLNEVLPGQDVWCESEAEARKALDAIIELYSRLEDALPHYSEAALEQEWIRPILDVLGHVYHVQPSLTPPAGSVALSARPVSLCVGRCFGVLIVVPDFRVVCDRNVAQRAIWCVLVSDTRRAELCPRVV